MKRNNLNNFGLTKKELKLFKSLNIPSKIQDFINKIPVNFEENGDTCLSPRTILKKNKCHCIEAAILAALILRVNNEKPLLVDLEANNKDYDHVITVFKRDGKWGAISKSNHVILRYREPVYNSVRELVMSYFNEYFNDDAKKTLRKYSNPVDLSRFDKKAWMTTEDEIWYIPDYLTKVKHYSILTRKQIKSLRKADKIEMDAQKLEDWKNKNKGNGWNEL